MSDPHATPPDDEPRAIAETTRPMPELATLVRRAMDGDSAGPPLTTGFPSLDALLGGGLRRGDLVVLAGDVGVGKSALALGVALRAAAAGHAVAFLTGEMTAERVVERALAMQGRTRIDDLRRGVLDDTAHEGVAAAALALRTRAPVIERLQGTGVAGVSDLLVQHLGIDLVVVDPVQFLASGEQPLDEALARLARELKELAMRRSAAVLAVSHLAAAPRQRADPRPRLEDLGGLGALRQQADVVLGLYREELYDSAPGIDGASELHVLKNRGGANGFVDLYFYKRWMRFEDMLEPNR